MFEKSVFTTLPNTFFSDRFSGLVSCEFSFSEIAESCVLRFGVIFFRRLGVYNFRLSYFIATVFFTGRATVLLESPPFSGFNYPMKSDLLRICPCVLGFPTFVGALIDGRFGSSFF